MHLLLTMPRISFGVQKIGFIISLLVICICLTFAIYNLHPSPQCSYYDVKVVKRSNSLNDNIGIRSILCSELQRPTAVFKLSVGTNIQHRNFGAKYQLRKLFGRRFKHYNFNKVHEIGKFGISSILPLAQYPLVPPPISTQHSTGPGENGKAVVINKKELSRGELKKFEEGEKNNAFNEYASSLISVRRYLPDFREPHCRKSKFPNLKITVSVILCFHNEAWTTLLRSVHSVLDHSPPYLLKEIILVDDGSTMEHLKGQLETYMFNFEKVRIIRTVGRQGLIRARLEGVRFATAPVLAFLDSHIECISGWLEPLLDRIAQNYSKVVSPVIDSIDEVTLAYQHSPAQFIQLGGFSWSLQYIWQYQSKLVMNRQGAPFSPIRTPTIAGGLFAIHADFFKHIGYYDSDFEVWGGENLELSFKTWMCGGTLEIIPCSHVGHIFRSWSPYSWDVNISNPLLRNNMRLAEVWLDDYKYFYLANIGNKKIDYGDVSERKALRERLKCHSFNWYLDNIYPTMLRPNDFIAIGEVRNIEYGTCLDSKRPRQNADGNIDLWPCHKQGGNQFWMLTKNGKFMSADLCADSDHLNEHVILTECRTELKIQEFTYNENDQIVHYFKCLEAISINTIGLRECDKSDRQRWIWNRKPFQLMEIS